MKVIRLYPGKAQERSISCQINGSNLKFSQALFDVGHLAHLEIDICSFLHEVPHISLRKELQQSIHQLAQVPIFIDECQHEKGGVT